MRDLPSSKGMGLAPGAGPAIEGLFARVGRLRFGVTLRAGHAESIVLDRQGRDIRSVIIGG